MTRRPLLAILLIAGCRQILGIEPLEVSSDDDGGPPDASIEEVSEIEPNDSPADADNTGVVLGCGSRALGDLAIDGVDFYRLELTSDAAVRVEVFEPDGQDCATIDPYLRIHDPSSVRFEDDDSGIGGCPATIRKLTAGVWYLEVGAAEPYLLEVACPSLAGSEVEPNEPCTNGTPISGTDVYVTGSHDSSGNYVDYWLIEVEEGQSIRAEIIEGGDQSCDALEMDPLLRLFVSTAEVVDEDSGRGSCALIDGTGGAPKDPLAHSLATDSYCLMVNAPNDATPTTATFDYQLHIRLR